MDRLTLDEVRDLIEKYVAPEHSNDFYRFFTHSPEAAENLLILLRRQDENFQKLYAQHRKLEKESYDAFAVKLPRASVFKADLETHYNPLEGTTAMRLRWRPEHLYVASSLGVVDVHDKDRFPEICRVVVDTMTRAVMEEVPKEIDRAYWKMISEVRQLG